MLGIVVLLVISWLLLHLVEKKNLFVLGFRPIGSRLLEFVFGFLFLGMIHLSFIFLEQEIKGTQWIYQTPFDYSSILESWLYHLRSALTEDLLFRGALLYVLISRLGARNGILLSAMAFGVYHWFSYGMVGGPIGPMIFIFVITGLMGYSWGLAYQKTGSILMPLGFHLGWNFVSTLFQPVTPYGELLAVANSSEELMGLLNLAFQISKGLLPPLLIILVLRHFEKKEILVPLDV